jgi:hypothetical protein
MLESMEYVQALLIHTIRTKNGRNSLKVDVEMLVKHYKTAIW